MKKAVLAIVLLAAVLPLRAQTAEEVVTQNILVDAVSKLETAPGEAISELQYLDQHYPADDAVKYQLGMAYWAAGNTARAEEYLLAATALDSTNFWYKDALAAVYSAQGRGEESSAIYLELLEKQPGRYSSPYTLTVQGDKYLSEYKDTLALESYERALEYDPAYAPALLGRAEVNRMRGNVPGFLAGVHEFTLNPDINPSAKCAYVQQILNNINYPFYRSWGTQLDSLVTGCVRTHPADSSALRLAGSWFWSTDRKDVGRQYFERLFEAYPENLQIRYMKLSLMMTDGNLREVVEECEQIVKMGGKRNPEVTMALTAAAECWHAIGNDRKAMRYYDKVLRIDPYDASALNNYAYYLSLAGRKLKKAEKMSRTALDLEPDNPSYLDTYGWILHLLGRSKEAKPYFKRAMVYGGKDHVEILEHYSIVLKALGEEELSKYYKSLAESKRTEQ